MRPGGVLAPGRYRGTGQHERLSTVPETFVAKLRGNWTARGVPARPPSIARAAAGRTPGGLPLARPVLQRALNSLFASSGRRYDPTVGLGDPGLLGPGAASWAILAEPAGIAAGVRALVVQALHPLAMAGVAQHSDYSADPLGRLERTSAYVTTSAFGSTDAAVRVARITRAMHRKVRGTASDGRPYRADDPDLLVWVSAAFTASLLEADRLWAPTPAGRGDADRFCDEQARIAALLDPRADLDALAADPGFGAAMRAGELGTDELPLLADLPRDLGALRGYLAEVDRELEATPEAHETWAFLRNPPIPPALRASHWVLYAGVVASLPRRHREWIGGPTDRVSTAIALQAANATIAGLRLAGGRSPAIAAATARSEGRVWAA